MGRNGCIAVYQIVVYQIKSTRRSNPLCRPARDLFKNLSLRKWKFWSDFFKFVKNRPLYTAWKISLAKASIIIYPVYNTPPPPFGAIQMTIKMWFRPETIKWAHILEHVVGGFSKITIFYRCPSLTWVCAAATLCTVSFDSGWFNGEEPIPNDVYPVF